MLPWDYMFRKAIPVPYLSRPPNLFDDLDCSSQQSASKEDVLRN